MLSHPTLSSFISKYSSDKMYNPLTDKSETSDHDSQSEDCETLLSNGSESSYKPAPRRRNLTWLYITLIPTISVCLVGLGAWIGVRWMVNENSLCAAHNQEYSPILKEVDNSIQTVRFNGSLLKENVFRQDAGPEVDAAWNSLGVNYRSLAVPESEAAATGLQPDQVKINQKYGGGFPANVEGLHHLHCLNLVRQSLYYNHDYYKAKGEGAFTNDDNIVRYHVSHCLDIIRQQLMCQPDTGLLGQVWWDPHAPKAFVDFNTDHKCKNFDAIKQWAEERQIPATVPMDFLQPPKIGDTVYEAIP
ncbi:tat pathway signal sequence [Phlyctema vagabunda]|uniref:Tat pathway signal sequence n=1 Tax=Phlyctema vagabunda TaxID=108571 RepID=A0ABR4PI31_9HELO